MSLPFGLFAKLAFLVINVVDTITSRVHERRQERRRKKMEKLKKADHAAFWKAHDADIRRRRAARKRDLK